MGRHYVHPSRRRWPGRAGFVRDLWKQPSSWHRRTRRIVSWDVRFPLPLGLLLASLGLTAIAAIDAHRVASSQRETADRAMREFASFAAWSYNERLELRLEAMLRSEERRVGKERRSGWSPQHERKKARPRDDRS